MRAPLTLLGAAGLTGVLGLATPLIVDGPDLLLPLIPAAVVAVVSRFLVTRQPGWLPRGRAWLVLPAVIVGGLLLGLAVNTTTQGSDAACVATDHRGAPVWWLDHAYANSSSGDGDVIDPEQCAAQHPDELGDTLFGPGLAYSAIFWFFIAVPVTVATARLRGKQPAPAVR